MPIQLFHTLQVRNLIIRLGTLEKRKDHKQSTNHVPGGEVRLRIPQQCIRSAQYPKSGQSRQNNQARHTDEYKKEKEEVERTAVCFTPNVFAVSRIYDCEKYGTHNEEHCAPWPASKNA